MALKWFSSICEAMALGLISNHSHFVLWKRERKGNRRGGMDREGGERRKRNRSIWKPWVEKGSESRKMLITTTLTRFSQTELLSTHQKLMASKTFSTISCLIELHGNGRKLFLRTEISGREKEEANKAGSRHTELVEQAPTFSRKANPV